MDALDEAIGKVIPEHAPAKSEAAPVAHLQDMDGTDLGQDSNVGPDVYEPSQEELHATGLDQPYTNPKTKRVSPGVTLPAQAGPQPTAAPAPTGDALDAAIAKVIPTAAMQDERDGRAGKLLAYKAQQGGLDPETARSAVALSHQTGMPAEFVAQNLDTVQKQADDQTAQWTQTAREAPVLAKLAASDGVHPAAFGDDLTHLSLLQRAITDPWHRFMDFNAGVGEHILDTGKAVAAAPGALIDSMFDEAKVALQMQDFVGMGSPENTAQIKGIEAEHPESDYGVQHPLGKAILGATKAIPYIVFNAAAEALGAGVGGVVGAGGASMVAAGELGAGPEAAPAAAETIAAGEALGGKGGGFVGSVAFNGAHITGPVYAAVKDKLDADGKPIDPTVARLVSGTAGLLGGVGMAAGGGITGKLLGGYVEPWLQKIPGGQAVLNRFGAEAVAKEIASSGWVANADRVLARWGVHQLQGMVTMAEQSLVTTSAEELGNVATGGDFSVKHVLTSSLDAFGKAFNDFALLSVHGVAAEHAPALAMIEAKGKEASSAENANRLAAIVAAVQGSKTAEKTPESIHALVSRAKGEPDAVQSVHVDKAAWDRLWQDEKTDPAAAARAIVGDDGKAYHQAKASGGAVVIPIERFAMFARSKYAERLLPDARLSQDDFTPNEMKARREETAKRFKELSVIEPDQMTEDARAVYDDFKRKALGAKRGEQEADANAKIVASAMQATSERFARDGKTVSPFELYTGRTDVPRDLNIEGPRGQMYRDPTEPIPETPQREEQRKAFEDLPLEQKRQRFFVDHRTGLYNFRGYEARPDDMARPYTTEVQLGQSKTINDALGHDYGDHALKVLAKVTRDAGVPDAARRGNTVAFDHATPEQGAEIVKKMQEALGHGQVVTSGTVHADAMMTPAERLEAAGRAHSEFRKKGQADKSIPMRDAPYGPEAAGFKEHLDKAQRVDLAPVTEAHAENYAAHVEEHDPFDTVHLTREGALTEDGWHVAKDLAEKRAEALAKKKYGEKLPKDWRKEFIHYASVDARGIGKLNTEFGRGATDQIMSALTTAMVRANDQSGRGFDLSHPHGDEFYIVHVGERAKLEKFLNEFAKESERFAFWKLDGDNVVLQRGVQLAHGLGADFHEADSEALPAAKSKQVVREPEHLHRSEFDRLERAGSADGRGYEFVRVGQASRGPGGGESEGVRSGGNPVGGVPAEASGGAQGEGGRGGEADRGERGTVEFPAGDGRGDGSVGQAEPGGAAGRSEEDPGAAGVRARQPGEIDVAPEVAITSLAPVPLEKDMGRAEQMAARMQSATKRAETEDFLQYVRDYYAGRATYEYTPRVPRDVLNKLAAMSIIDPEYGYQTAEERSHQKRGGSKDRRNGPQTAYDRAVQMDRRAHFDKYVKGKLDQQRLQSRTAPAAEPNLLVQHNLTEENLAHADELGGLVAPSLAIARKEHPLTGFGDVTLLAHPSLAEPKAGTPAFESDIYSPRHPRAQYEVKEKALDKILDGLRPIAKDVGASLGAFHEEIKRRGVAGAINERGVKPALEAAFLKEKGVDFKPQMQDAQIEHDISSMPALRRFFAEHGANENQSHGDAHHQAMSKAVSEAIDELAAKRSDGDKAEADDIRATLRDVFLDEESGLVFYGRIHRLVSDAKRFGTKEVNVYGTHDALDREVKKVGEAEFKKWATDLLKPAEGAAHIRKVSETTGNARRIPYTLENVLKEMTRKLRQGESFNYGLGTARAAGSKRFRSLADIQKARDRITSKAEFDKVKKANDDRFGELSDELRQYHSDPKGFHVLDSLAEAIGESYKRGHSLAKELDLSQFKDVPPELVAKTSAFARDLLAMPTEYFEAKPQRAVGIHEFRAAVVPDDAKPETLATLKKHGLDVETYPRGDEKARQEAIARVAGEKHILFQPSEGGAFTLESSPKRGEIVFTPAGTAPRRTFDISLFARADKSTLAHETFHFLSEVFGDVAQRPDAPADLKADYSKMLKFMEYDTHEQRVAEGQERAALGNIKPKDRTKEQAARLRDLTGKEERITHAWEQFLMEGKSPSVELAGAFTRFRAWLTGIYKTLTHLQENFRAKFGKDIGLTDEIRGVFNRFLASDQEIEKQKAAANAQPFENMAEKMSPADRADYERLTKQQVEDAKTELNRRIAEASRRENSKLADADREKLRASVNAGLDADPTYRAIDYLQTGKAPEGNAVLEGRALNLDRKAVAEKYGKEFARDLSAKHPGIFAAKDGVSTDELAGLLGYQDGDGDAMVRAMAQAEPRASHVEAEVQKQLLAKYPDLMDNPKEMGKEALDALQNDAAVRRAIHERRAIAKEIDPTRTGKRLDLDPEYLKATAERLVRLRTVGDITAGDEGAAGYYRRAQQAATRRMREAYEAGKLDRALGENEAIILNMHLWRAATDLRAELTKGLDLLNRSAEDTWRAALGKADMAADGVPAYRDAHDAILAAVDVRPADPNRPAPGIDALVQAAGANAQELGFDVDAIRALIADPTAWKDLSVDDAENVIDAVKNIRQAANHQSGIDLDGKRIETEKFYADVEGRLAGIPTAGRKKFIKEQAGFLAKKWDGLTGGLEIADAKLMGIEKLINVLTNGDRDSPLYKLAVEDEHACRGVKMALGKEVMEDLQAKFEKVPKEFKKRLNDLVDMSDLPLPQELVDQNWMTANGKMKLKDALTLALNMGNADNKQRLLDGYGWTEEQAMKALDREIGKPGWEWAQGVLDTLEKLYPHIEKVHEQETGLKPGKVAATPIKSAHGTFRGGYFPLKADPRFKNQTAERQEAGPVAQMFGPNYVRASTAKGHTKDRVAKAQYQVNLDFNSVQAHVAQVIHDVAYRRWVKDMARVQSSGRFATIIKKHLGDGYLMQFDPWLKTIANGQADAIPANQRGENALVGGMRNVIATQGLALNLPLALAHAPYPLAFVGTGEVGPIRMTKAMAQTYGAWPTQRKFVLDNSIVMRERAQLHGGELKSALDAMGANTTKWQRIAEHVKYGALEWAEKVTATASWKARYEQEIAGGATHKEAVREADSMINNLYISKNKADLPSIIRDKGAVGSLLMFYGYMNKMAGAQREWARNLHVAFADEDKPAKDKAIAAAKFAGKVLGLTLTQGIASEALGGKGPDKDEDFEDWLFRRALVFQASMIPFLGPVVDALVLGKKVSLRQAPALAIAQEAAEKVGAIAKSVRDGDTDEAMEQTLLQLGLGVAAAKGVPMYPAKTTGAYLQQAATGDAEVGPIATPKGLVYGPEK